MSFYKKIQDHFVKISHYNHLYAVCSWDQSTFMPPGGQQARSEALAEVSALIHQLTTAPQIADWIQEAEQENLTPDQSASLAAIRCRWQKASKLPEKLVVAKSLATSNCEHAWREQRTNNDWISFKYNLEEVIQLAREEADVRSSGTQLSRYDSLLDIYEPGFSSKQADLLFNEIKSWLPELIEKAETFQASRVLVLPSGEFPVKQQKKLVLEIMKRLGFDFSRGRLDKSAHPFCGGVPTDVRITTRYDRSNFMKSLLSSIHETGHACYEQNLPSNWINLPVGEARSVAMHESQSLLFEMQLARSPEFIQMITPYAVNIFSRQGDPAFTPQNLYHLNTRISRGKIRLEADELTYCAHIILRYEIEKLLIEGDVNVSDIPELWDQKMRNYLDLSTNGNYREGCMQDIHWSCGAFGYFPTYTLGAMYAAQQYSMINRAIPDLSQSISAGNIEPLFNWLRDNIWEKASFITANDLITCSTGEPLNPRYFKLHLERRYLS